MSLDATASPEAAEVTTEEVVDTKPTSSYSVTDPGYAGIQDEPEDDLEALRAENTKKKPSETLDDASEVGDDDAEETVETPADDEPADSDEISDELLDRAVALGYTIDEIKAFSDSKSLEKEISRVERINQRLQAKKQAETSPAETKASEEPEPEPDWDALIEQGHDPDLIALQKKNWELNKQSLERAQKAEAQVQQLIQAERTRAFEAQCLRFDNTLDSLGEEYKSLFGTGRIGELQKKSPELAANRQKVFTKMAVLRNAYEIAGEPVPAEADLIQEAVQASFYKQTQQIARKAITKEIRKSGSQALSRPRSTGGKPLSGPDRALAMEQEFWRNHS